MSDDAAGFRYTSHDTIWGDVTLPGFVTHVVHTPTFQRLNYLRQNGMLYLLYTGATHTRFAHSVGTAALAHKLVRKLAVAQPELGITDGEVHTVVLAALCHDLGHGPTSHGFDLFMHAVVPEWSHEHQSVALLQHLCASDDRVQCALRDADIDLHVACELILGSKSKAPKRWRWRGPSTGRAFLYEIVSSSSTGIDVDKWDYLRRDAFHLAIPTGFVCKRLLNGVRVLADGRLAWPNTEIDTITAMFHVRFQLHDRVYQCAESRVLDRMAMHALYAMRDYVIGHVDGDGADADARSEVTIATAYAHPAVYARLTDTLIDAGLQDALDTMRCSVAARALYARLQRRDLWPLIAETLLPKTFVFTVQKVVETLSDMAELSTDSFCVDVAYINCGRGRRNPMRHVPLYTSSTTNTLSIPTPSLPASFQKRMLRVFVHDAENAIKLTAAVKRWIQEFTMH
jgi:HD superfamily phosphohydrolase